VRRTARSRARPSAEIDLRASQIAAPGGGGAAAPRASQRTTQVQPPCGWAAGAARRGTRERAGARHATWLSRVESLLSRSANRCRSSKQGLQTIVTRLR
jgi:hypothetical protein